MRFPIGTANSAFKISYGIESRGQPAVERMGVLSSSARKQPSARGRLWAAVASQKPQFKMKN